MLDAGPQGFEGGHEHKEIRQSGKGLNGDRLARPRHVAESRHGGYDRAGQVHAILDQPGRMVSYQGHKSRARIKAHYLNLPNLVFHIQAFNL